MGTVFKKSYTKPLPDGAKIIIRKGRRLAEWIDGRGKRRTAPLTVDGNREPDRRGSRNLHRKIPRRGGDRPGSGHRLPGRIGRPVGSRKVGTPGGTGQGRSNLRRRGRATPTAPPPSRSAIGPSKPDGLSPIHSPPWRKPTKPPIRADNAGRLAKPDCRGCWTWPAVGLCWMQ